MKTPARHASPAACAVAGWLLPVAFATAPALAQDFGACVRALRGQAIAQGIAPRTFDAALAGVEFDASVVAAMESQPEFTIPVWDYVASLVDEQRIADGRERLAQWAAVLAKIEDRFGVDRHTVVALWGVETDYGRRTGKRPILRSLATASCHGGRQPFFRGELIAALRIVQAGDLPAESLTGSWAGAFGQTQFMPSTFHRAAVDFDDDGRRDIVGSVPDALASAANYLRNAGWGRGEPWGYEVALPAGYDGPSGRRNRRAPKEWARLGIRRLDGGAPAGAGAAALLLPAGAGGPAFLVFRNFQAIYTYNASESYALSIAHLADRLRGGGPIRAPWPTDDAGLSRAERRELQERLSQLGHDVGEADGIIGLRTREAIKAFQASAGMTVDGYPGARVLRALRESAARSSAPAQ